MQPSQHRKQIRQSKKNIERLLWLAAGALVATVYAIYFVIGG